MHRFNKNQLILASGIFFVRQDLHRVVRRIGFKIKSMALTRLRTEAGRVHPHFRAGYEPFSFAVVMKTSKK
jgi:hypothetical protein